MAESGLSIDINALRLEVGVRHGWGADVSKMSSAQLANFDRISKRALREFYFPPIDGQTPYYEWNFLRKNYDVTLATNDGDYTLPDDFTGNLLDEACTINVANAAPPQKVPEHNIRNLWVNESTATGLPEFYAIRNLTHNAQTGQRWEMLVHPKPVAAQNGKLVTIRYIYMPEPLTNTNKYPVGGAQYSEAIVASHLAAAELIIDGDPEGPYRKQFITLLATAMRADQQSKLTEGGIA